MNENFGEKINDIVFDTLARRCSVYIDGIGSLMLSSENALTKVAGKVHSYPYYKVTLVKGERFGIDLKAHCLSIVGVDKQNVSTVFGAWLTECGIMPLLSPFTINGVVAYDNGVVKMSDGLNKSLNPLYGESEEGGLSQQSKRKVNVVVIALVAVIVVAIVSYMFLLSADNYDIMPPQKTEIVKQEPVVEPTIEEPVVEEEIPVEPITNTESFNLVVGVFSTRENVDKYLEGISSSMKNGVKIGSKYYAIVGTYNTEQEANVEKSKSPLDCWVLNIKNNKPIYKEQ